MAFSIFTRASLSDSASADNLATSDFRASSIIFSKGLEIQSPPNSITTPIATRPNANSLVHQRIDSQYDALATAGESIASSHRIHTTFGLRRASVTNDVPSSADIPRSLARRSRQA